MRTQCPHQRSITRQRFERLTLGGLALTALSVLAGPGAQAAPQGGQVVRGDAQINQQGNQTTVQQNTREAIIEYRNFDIGAAESVRFVQPSEQARVLNRVTGSSASNIAGRLTANGQVYLVNPNGVYFADGAQINVGGLYAAAGSMSNSDFLAGRDHFSNLSGEVINYGTIEGGDIHLMGRRVANFGDLSSNGGVMTMLAGEDVVIREVTGRVSVKIDGKRLLGNAPHAGQSEPSLAASPGVENAGSIDAGNGQVTLGAGDMYSLAVRNSGPVNAPGGRVEMAATDGAVHNTANVSTSVADGQAGSIAVQAPSIANEATLSADAGTGQAGEITVLAQNHVLMPDGSVVSAAGLNGATGGRVIVNAITGYSHLADGAVLDVSSVGGAGGFAEFSGQSLTLDGDIELAGATPGEFLLDPEVLIIGRRNDDDGLISPPPAGQPTLGFGSGPDTTYLSADKVEDLDGLVTLQAENEIRIDEALHFGTARPTSVVFEVLNDDVSDVIKINADITSANPLRFGQYFFGPVELGKSTVTLEGKQVYFENTVDAMASGAQSLNILGNATFNGVVGGTRGSGTELDQLDVRNLTTINASRVATTGAQNYGQAVTIGETTTLESPLVSVGDLLRKAQSAPTNTNLLIEGNAVLQGNVGDSTTSPQRRLNNLRITGTTEIVGGTAVGKPYRQIKTTGTQTYEGQVTLTGATHTRMAAGGQIDIAGGAEGPADLVLDSIEGNPIRFNLTRIAGGTPLGSLSAESHGGLINITDSLVEVDGDIELNPNGRATVPGDASIAAPNGSLAIVSRTGDITMGQNEAISVLGDVAFWAPAGEVTLGDVSALGNWFVGTNTLTLQTGPGINYVIGGQRVGTPGAITTTGPPAVLSTPQALTVAPGADPTLFAVRLNSPLSASDFFRAGGSVVLNLDPFGPQPQNRAEFVPGEVPFSTEMEEPVLLGPSGRQAMAQLQLQINEASPQELANRLGGPQTIDDTGGQPSLVADADAQPQAPAQVSIYRVMRQPALRALQRYETVFGGSKREQIRRTLADLWSAYAESTSGEPSGRKWVSHLRQLDGSALTYLQQMRGLEADIREAGVSEAERAGLLSQLRRQYLPDGMTAQQFRDAIQAVQPAPLPGSAAQTASTGQSS
jgi:filamentous hemagglutinin family protein